MDAFDSSVARQSKIAAAQQGYAGVWQQVRGRRHRRSHPGTGILKGMIQSVLPHYFDYVDRAIPGHCDSPPRYADVKLQSSHSRRRPPFNLLGRTATSTAAESLNVRFFGIVSRLRHRSSCSYRHLILPACRSL